MRYFFRLTDGTNELNPHEGIDLLGNAAAREEAFKFARQIKMQKAEPGKSWDGWFVRIVDAARQGDRHRAVRCSAGRAGAVDVRPAASPPCGY